MIKKHKFYLKIILIKIITRINTNIFLILPSQLCNIYVAV